MWRFANPVRHPLPVARWPTAAEAAAAMLFNPIEIGPIRLTSRTWVPAMVPWRAAEDGFATDANIDWYARFAEGQPGALVVEATGIRDIPSGPLLRIGDDRFISGLRKIVEAVHKASAGRTRLLIQLIDFLAVKRRPSKEIYFARYFQVEQRHRNALAELIHDDSLRSNSDAQIRNALLLAPDDVLDHVLSARELEALRFGYRERVTDVDLDHVRQLPEVLPEVFAQAALRAREAGFDGVELHYAHAYTMASFLSALNTRDDGYGGGKEHRVRLPLEVYQAVRKQVGADYTVGVRFLSDDVVPGGSRIEDTSYFAAEFARAGFDFLSISKGGKFEDAAQPKAGEAVYPYTGRSGYECMPTTISDDAGPFGRNVSLARQIKAAVVSAGCNTPTVVAGGITTFDQAESILQAGSADVVGFARQALADPDWFLKVRMGLGADVRRCNYTNYCEALDQAHRQVTCKLWDRTELDELEVSLALDGRRRLLPPRWQR